MLHCRYLSYTGHCRQNTAVVTTNDCLTQEVEDINKRLQICGSIGSDRSRMLSVYQPIFYSVVNQLGVVPHLHFLKNTGAIGAYRFDAE